MMVEVATGGDSSSGEQVKYLIDLFVIFTT